MPPEPVVPEPVVDVVVPELVFVLVLVFVPVLVFVFVLVLVVPPEPSESLLLESSSEPHALLMRPVLARTHAIQVMLRILRSPLS